MAFSSAQNVMPGTAFWKWFLEVKLARSTVYQGLQGVAPFLETVRVSLGHHIAIPESLYQAFSNRETGHLSRFFCAWVSTSGSLYPCLYREKNTEPWDTRMKRADVKHRPLANTTLADTGLYLGTCAAPGAGWHVVRNRSSGRCCSIGISSKRQRAREITASRVQD